MKEFPEILKVSLSAEDKEAIGRAAAQAGLSLSAWARMTLLQATRPTTNRFALQPNHEVSNSIDDHQPLIFRIAAAIISNSSADDPNIAWLVSARGVDAVDRRRIAAIANFRRRKRMA